MNRTVDEETLIVWTGIPVNRGSTGACWVAIGGREQSAVGKRNDEGAGNEYIIYNELVGYRLAAAVDLPVPDSFVHSPPDAAAFFVQLNFARNGARPPPINPPKFVTDFPELAACIVAFDVLIVNTDRHAQNLARVARGDGERVYLFDHSHSLFGGRGHEPGPERLTEREDWLGCDGQVGNRHRLLQHLTSSSDLQTAISRVQSIEDDLIKSVVMECRGHGLSKENAELAESVLMERRDGLGAIVAANRDKFTGIEQWELFDAAERETEDE